MITNKEELKKLFEQAPLQIKTMIKGGELKEATTTIGQLYNLPVGKYLALSNIITFVLIGALDPKNIITALKDLTGLEEDAATRLANDLETSIFEKARVVTIGKSEDGVKTLEFKGERSKEELRKEILDTTKRESALLKPQSSPALTSKTSVITPGSRSQLLEQLQILGKIPNDEEIEERLSHIQEQIQSIKSKEDTTLLDSNIALKSFMFGEKGKEAVTPQARMATYSVAPTHYNLDPYRELVED
jgi:hypothetical protein